MRGIFYSVAVFFLGLVFQILILSLIGPIAPAPQILLLLTVTIGLFRGSFEAETLGLMWGICSDVLSHTVVGTQAMMLVITGYVVGRLAPYFDRDLVSSQMALTGIVSLLYWIGLVLLLNIFSTHFSIPMLRIVTVLILNIISVPAIIWGYHRWVYIWGRKLT